MYLKSISKYFIIFLINLFFVNFISAQDVVASDATTAATNNAATNRIKYLTAEGVPTCNSKDENLGECFKKIFAVMIPRFKNGDKELGIPQLDPLAMNRTTLQYKNGAATGRLTMKNAAVHGFTDLKFDLFDLKFDANGKVKGHTTNFLPQLRILGNYKGNFAINNAHLKPKGSFNITLVDIDLDMTSDGVVYEKDGHRFLRLLKFNAEPKIGDMKFNATGIFPDPSLNEIVLNVLNTSWRDIFRIMLPETRRYWAPAIRDMMNEAFTAVPLDNFITDL